MDDLELLTAFEDGTLEPVDFPHEAHVRVAWALSRRYPSEEAFQRLATGIRTIAARAGKPDAYHETITRAWFELIASADDLARHPELFDKGLLGRYYSQGALAAGRERWIEPDLHPLQLPPPPPSRRVDPIELLRRLPSTVAVIAAHAEGSVHATTVSSTVSVSRTPPLVSVCLAEGSRALALIREARAFALSFLAAGEAELATRFADPDRPDGAAQFADVPHRLSAYGPLLDDATAWLGCELHAVHACGDHHIVVGQVALADRAP